MQPWQLVLTIVLSHYSANLVMYLIVTLVTRKRKDDPNADHDELPLYEPSPALLRYCDAQGICPECARPLTEHEKHEETRP
jgi:hypothetical protein